jgi:hypothetical protein
VFETGEKAPTHRGLKVSCPKEGQKRGLRFATVDIRSTCLSGCPFYKGRDKDGIFCAFVLPRFKEFETSAAISSSL